jgi:hypothetical protein
MKNASRNLFLAPLAVAVLAGLTLAPLAEAAGRGGGHGGGGHHAGGGGGKRNVQANHNKRDVRTNNVRSTSVNNVNVNKNVNVNVDNNRGCCNNGWDNDYHPIATAAAVTATVAVTSAIVGSMVRTVPPGCVPVNYGGYVYQQCGSTWYQPQGSQYIVINPPY